MVSNRWQKLAAPFVVIALGSPLIMDCGALPSVPGVPGLPGNCPDMANAEAVAKFDWEKEFKLDAKVAGQLKGGLEAAINLQALSAKIDGELAAACNGLGKDLGGKGDAKSAPDACKAAITVMGTVKAKMGANAKLAIDIAPPVCSASMDAMAECAGSCDASVKGGKAEVKCEGGEISGTCDAKCSGSCQMEAAATCSGTCEGSCDASFTGTCGGMCDGKCDGKATAGAGGAECKGKCEGKCSAGAKGECKGKCGGSCALKGEAECKGTCSGKCSAEMKAPKCSGKVEPPQMSAECKASCDAKVSGKVECTPARVVLKIEGAADAAAAATYKAAIEKNLPLVLKIAIGMKDRVGEVAGSVKGVVEGAQGAVSGAVSGGPVLAAALTACVAAPFTGALDAAASLQASVDVSVDVKASASASGSASGGAKGSPER
jgi:hypothetical protein